MVSALKGVVPLARVELATRGLGNRCSIHLSYRGIKLKLGTYDIIAD